MTMANANQSTAPASWTGEDREFPLSEKDYAYLTSLVYERSGIVLGPSKMNMVYSRLVRRLRELRLASFKDYCKLVAGEGGDTEIGFLINAVTTNLTKFFRENHHFEHLAEQVIASIVRARQSRRIRIWSAGCSSGEEPHSIAITLAEALPDLDRWDAKILATDLDTSMVATGAAGLYATEAVSELPKAIGTKYFERVPGGDKSRVIDPIRKLISFKHLNLLGDWPLKGPFDAIFCRNVMIYFDGPTKINLVRRYGELLKPEGWLYIGHAESLQEQQTGFRPAGRTIYRKVS